MVRRMVAKILSASPTALGAPAEEALCAMFLSYGLPETAEMVTVLDVTYVRLKFRDGDELYLTHHGIPLAPRLHPRSFWTDEAWFRNNSTRLSGTSTIYRIRTRRERGPERDIVLKWNRMGQEPPGEDLSGILSSLKFNSPFEEFSLVSELREAGGRQPRGTVMTHRPLAIYVPAEKITMESSGRREHLMAQMVRSHREVRLDMFRNYAVVYEWLKGIDAAAACEERLIDKDEMIGLVRRAGADLDARGFLVGDSKPHHIIVRPDGSGGVRRDRSGRPLYGLVDFELLVRTPHREERLRGERRRAYLAKQRDRFAPAPASASWDGTRTLHPVNLLGVDYVYGQVGSTGGALWVVGKDPSLFDYFLPDKWEGTHRTRLSRAHDMFYTLTKDNIHLVWKVSRVGQKPDADPVEERGKRILRHGHNSPFEEVALALELAAKGIATTYPRAIYMGGRPAETPPELLDGSRYRSHEALSLPDGLPVLRPDRDYFAIWGYWNGPDDKLAMLDGNYREGINALRAYNGGLLGEREYLDLMERYRGRLLRAGFEDLNLRGSHLLLSLERPGKLFADASGEPEARVCNFELLKRVEAPTGAG